MTVVEKVVVEKLLVPPGTPFKVKFGDLNADVSQYLGVGTLNVDTGRGEVKAKSGDFVVTLPHCKFVVPQDDFEKFGLDVKLIPLDEFLEGKVLNPKSGPDKFTPPLELLSTQEPEESEKPLALPTSAATRITKSSTSVKN